LERSEKKQALDGSKKGANSDPYRSLEGASYNQRIKRRFVDSSSKSLGVPQKASARWIEKGGQQQSLSESRSSKPSKNVGSNSSSSNR